VNQFTESRKPLRCVAVETQAGAPVIAVGNFCLPFLYNKLL